jgi:hypothetical protein
VPEDELLTHQIFDTFATVSQSDPSWTEMIWTIAHARDNSLQAVVGIGKYTNRGVFDGAAGVCRGTEQWTVRAGRRLSSASASTDVGPIHYHVIEPLRAVRVSLDATEHAPIAFDVMYQEERGDGFTEIRCQAEQQNTDGTSHRFPSVEQDLHFQDDDRRFMRGTITLIDTDGTKRPLTVTAAGPTGFHLGTGGYYGWNDWVLGQWVGDLKVEGSHVTDCDKPENARELHQLRDLLVRVEDPVGGGGGLGNAETFALGGFPERGLTAENSFL